MKKAIVYSLFGSEENSFDNCFNFNAYLRGLMINIRLNKLLYPEWTTIIELEDSVYNKYSNLFNKLKEGEWADYRINQTCLLTKAMLWRLKPIFELDENQIKVWDYVLCRDLDSPTTYREVQAVKQWMNNDKTIHAITDSVSHTIPMLGGMIGFIPKYFTDRIGITMWDALFENVTIDFSKKGADQDFLNQHIYPIFAQRGTDSITQHYFKGMPNTFLSDFHTCLCDSVIGHQLYCPNNTETGLDEEMKQTNNIAGHIGSAGFYTTSTYSFLAKHRDKFKGLYDIEKDYPMEFHWINDKSF